MRKTVGAITPGDKVEILDIGWRCNRLQRFFTREGFQLRLNLPLDENAGAKLGLICKLRMRVKEMDRVELIARRTFRFTREEAAYWLSRATTYNKDANKWAQAGMKIMLGGAPGDAGVEKMLEKLRENG